MAVRAAQSQVTTPPVARKQDEHKRSDPKFEVQGSRFQKSRTVVRPAFLAVSLLALVARRRAIMNVGTSMKVERKLTGGETGC